MPDTTTDTQRAPAPFGSTEVQEEIAHEQVHVDRVYERLQVLASEAESLAKEGYGRGQLGSHAGLVERDAFVYHASRRLQMLNREHDGLVFGRLDLDGPQTRYIGRLGVLDETFEPLVVDWRAPVAAPFYGATAENRMEVIRRRVIRCSGQRVVGVEDDLLDIDSDDTDLKIVGDGALLAALTRARTGRMRDIVATIQREQDQAIRAPVNAVTLIGGGPGTGKTVVALHRAAYILYQDRRKFEGSGVMVVGPSPVFISYIERVLPSLGEDTATLRSIGDVVDEMSANYQDPPAVAAIKGGLRMRTVLTRAIREQVADGPRRLRILRAGQLLQLESRELERIRRTILSRGRKYNRSRRSAADAVLSALWRQATSDRPQQTGQDKKAEFDADLRDRDEFSDFMVEWWPWLSGQTVLARLADRATLSRCARGVLSNAEIGLLSASLRSAEEFKRVSAHDVALVDELRELLGDPPPPPPPIDPLALADLGNAEELTTIADRELALRARPERRTNYDEYGHIIVDEAQDLSPMQWRMLGRRGRYASWTVVGDPAQSSWPDTAEATTAMNEALRSRRRQEFHLSTNYRNSAEIFDLAGRVVRRAVPDADLPDAVRSTGIDPRHVLVDRADLRSGITAAVTELLDVVEGTIGVITAMERRDEVDSWLADLPAARVSVVNGLDAKGLEYDAVVVAEPGEIIAESGRGIRVLYVALTRATQRLTTVSTDQSWLPAENRSPGAVVSEVDPDFDGTLF